MAIPFIGAVTKIAGSVLDIGKRFIADKTKLAEFQNAVDNDQNLKHSSHQ